jgi:prolipoprotein diacylglyceryl transferase
VIAPLSIPSPPEDWQIPIRVPFGEWLHGILPFIPEGQVLEVRSYALAILAGIILATIWTGQRLKARGADPGIVLDVIIWAVPLGLVGARAYHVATHPSDFFYDGNQPWALFTDGALNPTSVYAIWEGGNALFGSLIGGAIGAYIGCRLAGIRFWTFADALAPAMLLAQVLGRLGNYFNHELFGTPTDLPWGLEIESSNPAFPVGLEEGTLFHPTFLYEMIWNTVGIVLLLAAERAWTLGRRRILGVSMTLPVGDRQPRLQWGKVWALYMVWYGLGRIVFESIRVDPSEVFLGIRTNVWGAVVTVLLGIALFVVQSRRHTGVEPSPYVPGREPEGAVDSPETYSDADEPDDAVDSATGSEKLATSGAGTPKP